MEYDMSYRLALRCSAVSINLLWRGTLGLFAPLSALLNWHSRPIACRSSHSSVQLALFCHLIFHCSSCSAFDLLVPARIINQRLKILRDFSINGSYWIPNYFPRSPIRPMQFPDIYSASDNWYNILLIDEDDMRNMNQFLCDSLQSARQNNEKVNSISVAALSVLIVPVLIADRVAIGTIF